jgi:hypothetical protein
MKSFYNFLIILLIQIFFSFSLKIKSDKLIFDETTNLMWMKEDFAFLNKRFLINWEECEKWRNEMNKKKYAGYSDWRVPTIKEYRTINKSKKDRTNYRIFFIELDTICVWGKGAYSFWSSTTPNKNVASYISFIDGFATSGERSKKFSNPYSDWKGQELGLSVRLVRENK